MRTTKTVQTGHFVGFAMSRLRWTEYCSDHYNYKINVDKTIFECPQIQDEEHHRILREEVEQQ